MSIGKAAPLIRIAFLALMAFLAGGAALRESVTIDEVAHIGAGVSALQKLDLRMNPEHPPLPKLLAALPLVLGGVHADYGHLSWTFSTDPFGAFLGEWVFGHWLIAQWNNPVSTVMWARIPMLLLTLALGWVVYYCGVRFGGPYGGLLCLAAYCTMPVFLVFGPLVLTDVAVTFSSLLTIWAFAQMWESGERRDMRRFGLLLGLSLLSKFSAGLLFFAFVAFALSVRWWPTRLQTSDREAFRVWWRRGWWNTFKGALWAAAMVYGVYFVLSLRQPTDLLKGLGTGVLSLVLRRLLLPAVIYLGGLIVFLLGSIRPSFLLGHAYPHGVWFYYPVLFALKTPLVFLGAVALAVAAGVARRGSGAIPKEESLRWRAVWVSFVVFTAACIISRFDISIRHFTIPMVLIILLLAPLPRLLGRWAPALVSAFATASVFTAVLAYPNFMPFINVLGRGQPAYHLVNDSNVDWNHALPQVQRFADSRGVSQLLVDEYGFSDPKIYVRQARLWNCQEPEPGDAGQLAVVSGNMIEESHNCTWLLGYPHETLAGGSMYAFHLPQVIPPAGSPGGPPVKAEFHNLAGFPGTEDMRLYFLDCIRDPQRLPETMERMRKLFTEAAEKK